MSASHPRADMLGVCIKVRKVPLADEAIALDQAPHAAQCVGKRKVHCARSCQSAPVSSGVTTL
jgi:hypothetical protein